MFASGVRSNGNTVKAKAAWGAMTPCPLSYPVLVEIVGGKWVCALKHFFVWEVVRMYTDILVCMPACLHYLCKRMCHFIQRVLSLLHAALACCHVLDCGHLEWHGKKCLF